MTNIYIYDIIPLAAYKGRRGFHVISDNVRPTIASLNKGRLLLMYAIIETGGKQYKVQSGDTVFVEKLEVADGDEITFDKVIAVGTDDGISVGAPYLDGATVAAKVIKNGKAKKIVVATYKSKKNEKRKLGHRQPYTKVEIAAING